MKKNEIIAANDKKLWYVDNIALTKALKDYKKAMRESKKAGKEERPPITNYIGECIYKIANRVSFMPSFINYSYREDMVSDGIENCLKYFHNYNPNAISKRTGKKVASAFAYFTQIIVYAFIRRIAHEEKQQYVKYKSLQHSNAMEELLGEGGGLENRGSDGKFLQGHQIYDNMSQAIEKFEAKIERKKQKMIEKKAGKSKLGYSRIGLSNKY